jgi:hypothetical protein
LLYPQRLATDGSTAAIPIPRYGVATLTIPVSALAACICPVRPERQDPQYIHREAINVMMQQSEQGVQSVEHTQATSFIPISSGLPNGDLLYTLARTKPKVLALRVTIRSINDDTAILRIAATAFI